MKWEYEKVDAGAIPLITHKSPIRPDSHYGVSKPYGKALGRFHSEEHGLSVSCLRIGGLRPIYNPFGGVEFYAPGRITGTSPSRSGRAWDATSASGSSTGSRTISGDSGTSTTLGMSSDIGPRTTPRSTEPRRSE